MTAVITAIVAVFFCAGLVDSFLGDRWGLGAAFSNGIKALGGLLVGMAGIYSLAPLLSGLFRAAFAPLSRATGIDPSVFPSMLLAVDMGAFSISRELGQDPGVAAFAGVILSSTMGTAVSFSFPVAAGLVAREDTGVLLQGFVWGLLSLLPGCVAGGLVQGLAFATVLRCMLPMLVLAALLCALLFLRRGLLMALLRGFNRLIVLVGYVGLAAQAVALLTGWTPIPGMVPMGETALVVVRIAFFLCGMYPLLQIVRALLRRRFDAIERTTGLDRIGLLCAVGNLVSNVMVFDLFARMSPRGKLLCAMMAFGPAFMIGGQLAYVTSVARDMTGPFLATKIVSGVACIVLYMAVAKRGVGAGAERGDATDGAA